MVWIESAAARISLLLMLAACPRYAEAPRFSTVAARAVTCAALWMGNLPVGSCAAVPSWPATV
jgi:hypothetical protein